MQEVNLGWQKNPHGREGRTAGRQPGQAPGGAVGLGWSSSVHKNPSTKQGQVPNKKHLKKPRENRHNSATARQGLSLKNNPHRDIEIRKKNKKKKVWHMLDRLQAQQTHQVFLTQPGVVFVTCYQHHTEQQPRRDAGRSQSCLSSEPLQDKRKRLSTASDEEWLK